MYISFISVSLRRKGLGVEKMFMRSCSEGVKLN
jgi:hypothetical protein